MTNIHDPETQLRQRCAELKEADEDNDRLKRVNANLLTTIVETENENARLRAEIAELQEELHKPYWADEA